MNNYISVEVFIENDISGDWGKEFPDEKHKTKVFCVRGADINDLNIGKIENLPVRYVKEASKDKFLEKGNIIIEISGGSPTQSTGRVAFLENIDREVVCSNFCRALKIKKEYSPKYVFYLLQNIYNSGVFFYFESKTSGIKNLLYNSAFENIKVPNRDYSSQQKIENVITVIDKKIQLLHQINDNLAELAKTIYDYWFVQFDFPDENGKPYKTSGGKMVYNEVLKREIPEGWEVKRLGEILKKNETTIKINAKDYLSSGSIPIIDQSSDFICGYTNEISALIKASNIPAIIFGDHTRILKFIDFDFARGADGTQILFSNNEKMPQYLFYHSLLKIDLSNYGYARHFKFLKEQKILLSDRLIAEKFTDNVKTIYEKIKINRNQIQHLQSLRDWLLPMLMNGQVSVE